MNDDEALLLTTLDNPFSPFNQFEEWKEFDETKGYFTCNLLGRLSFTSSELTEEQNKRLQNITIRDIVDNDETEMYIMVTRNSRILAKID